MRIFGEELVFFFGKEWAWNWLDFSLVLATMAELAASTEGSPSTSFTSMRLWRLSRAVRSFRLVRLLQRFRDFRMLLLAVQNSLATFTHVCMFLFWILCVSSVVFLNGVADYITSGGTEAAVVDALQSLFGAFELTWLTLFMSITGGLSWEVALNAMFKVHPIYGLLFVLFIASMMLAALNIVAGIFVNDAIEMAQKDRDYALHSESVRNNEMISGLKELFRELDTDQSGTLTLAEFMEAWKRPDVLTWFRLLGVEFLDAQSLFESLDTCPTEAFEIDEFITFCLRAKTMTRPVDLQYFMAQHRRNSQWLHIGLTNLERQIDRLEVSVKNVFSPQQQALLRTPQRQLPGVPTEPAACRPRGTQVTVSGADASDYLAGVAVTSRATRPLNVPFRAGS